MTSTKRVLVSTDFGVNEYEDVPCDDSAATEARKRWLAPTAITAGAMMMMR